MKIAMIHPTAEVSPEAQIGEGTKIWHQAQVREGARIGCGCIICKGVYIDRDVIIGAQVKIQNRASIYHGVTTEDGGVIGPNACLEVLAHQFLQSDVNLDSHGFAPP